MKHELYVLQTANNLFVSIEQTGEKELSVYEVEEYYNADKFDSMTEVDNVKQLAETGQPAPGMRADWTLRIEPDFLPLKRRTFIAELVEG